jgi:hypothetical protein
MPAIARRCRSPLTESKNCAAANCGSSLQAIHKTDTPPGPAGRWLIERLVTLSDAIEAPIQGITKPIKSKRRQRSRRRAVVRNPRK